MAKLKTYREKRLFERTPEPEPTRPAQRTKKLRFCVQKHSARHLHYDLRLELDGVLLSWAVPKGPSMDPNEKRLAIHVEDHPLEYINFKGTIPAGNYGAGTVEIWDRGTYDADLKEMRAGLKKGHLRFFLRGKKLFGEFHLIKLNSKDRDHWLLKKTADISEAVSPVDKIKGRKAKMPDYISPMLATLTDKPFDSDEWLFEVKWDGYRALAFINGKRIQLYSRNQLLYNKDYPQLLKELKNIKDKVILDGEIVVLDNKGISRFELLQNCKKNPDCELHYMVFDLLYLNGHDLRSEPLIERKEVLKTLLEKVHLPALHYSDHVDEKGISLFREAKAQGLEGLIAKQKASAYVSKRSASWLKIKTSSRQEFVVGGATLPRKSRSSFGSLLLGTFNEEGLKFVGHVGTGFSENELKDIYRKMTPLIRVRCPFANEPKTNEPAIWLKPQLIAEVSFTERTKQGILRHPVFHGFRSDKSAKEVHEEQPIHARTFRPSNADKVFWPKDGFTKGDLLNYYEAVSRYILPHLRGRPLTMHRFPDGIFGADFYQKTVLDPPRWLTTAAIYHKSKKAKEKDQQPVVNNLTSLLYIANLGSIEMHPMLTRMDHLDHHDILAIDLDPEALPFKKVVEVAQMAHALLSELKLPHFCKTSGGRGLHLYVPLGKNVYAEQAFNLSQLLAHLLRQKMPSLISLERMPAQRQKRVYVDYLQNQTQKSMVSPYSVRPLPHAPVSTPIDWKELKDDLDPLDFTILTVPKRLKKIGDIFAPVLTKSINLRLVLKRIAQLL